MATKQEKAVQRAIAKEKKQGKVREEKHILWFLIALILALLYLLLAQHFGWWPNSRPKLGTAFYTNISANVAKPSSATTSSSSTGTSSGTGSTGGGSSTTTTSGGSTTAPATTPSSIVSFAAGVNVGSTKEQVTTQANGLGQGCAVIANANLTAAGHQEVCTYAQGDKIITVTYLNDHVVSASKSGF